MLKGEIFNIRIRVVESQVRRQDTADRYLIDIEEFSDLCILGKRSS